MTSDTELLHQYARTRACVSWGLTMADLGTVHRHHNGPPDSERIELAAQVLNRPLDRLELDVSAIVSVFSEMATRLGGDSRTPAKAPRS